MKMILQTLPDNWNQKCIVLFYCLFSMVTLELGVFSVIKFVCLYNDSKFEKKTPVCSHWIVFELFNDSNAFLFLLMIIQNKRGFMTITSSYLNKTYRWSFVTSSTKVVIAKSSPDSAYCIRLQYNPFTILHTLVGSIIDNELHVLTLVKVKCGIL